MFLLSSQTSQQQTHKQNEELKREVNCLRSELQQVRDERDSHLSQVHHLNLEVVKFNETTVKTSKDLDNVTTKAIALQVCWKMCLSFLHFSTIYDYD